MFANKGSKSSVEFRIFLLLILSGLIISGDGFVLGRQWLRYPNHIRHRHDLSSSDNDDLLKMESNDLEEVQEHKLEDAVSEAADIPNLELPEFPTLRRQPQPEDFVFPDEIFDVENELSDKTNDKLIISEGLPKEIESGIENTLDDEEKYEDSVITAPPPGKPPVIGGRNIITAPLKDCRKGERRDSKGECRLVLK